MLIDPGSYPLRVAQRTALQTGIKLRAIANDRGIIPTAGTYSRGSWMSKSSDGESRNRGGVQTVETVLHVLNTFIGEEPAPMLKTIAKRAGMHPAKVHRYLVSCCKSGYVRQDPGTGRYRLGPATLLLGYAAMNAIPVVPVVRPVLKELSETNHCSAFLALWSSLGPRIVLQEIEAAHFTVSAHVGSIFPLLSSSTGRTFAAWLPPKTTLHLLDKELAAFEKKPVLGCPASMAEAESLFAEIRRRGLERATGQLSAAVHGLSAPVFDENENICAVITIMGQAGQFNTKWRGTEALALTQAAEHVSSALKQRVG